MYAIQVRRAFTLPWDESTTVASRYDRVSPPNSCVLSPSLSVYHHQINAPPSSSSPPSRDLQDSGAYSDMHTTNKESTDNRRRSPALGRNYTTWYVHTIPYHTTPHHASVTATATTTAGATSCLIGIEIEVELACSLAVQSQSESFFPQKPVSSSTFMRRLTRLVPHRTNYSTYFKLGPKGRVQYNCTSDVQIRIDALKEAHRWGPTRTRKEMSESFTGSAIAGGPRCRHTRAHKPT